MWIFRVEKLQTLHFSINDKKLIESHILILWWPWPHVSFKFLDFNFEGLLILLQSVQLASEVIDRLTGHSCRLKSLTGWFDEFRAVTDYLGSFVNVYWLILRLYQLRSSDQPLSRVFRSYWTPIVTSAPRFLRWSRWSDRFLLRLLLCCRGALN